MCHMSIFKTPNDCLLESYAVSSVLTQGRAPSANAVSNLTKSQIFGDKITFFHLYKKSLMTKDRVVGPFNENNHWCLFVMYVSLRKIIFIDPKREASKRQISVFLKNLQYV